MQPEHLWCKEIN